MDKRNSWFQRLPLKLRFRRRSRRGTKNIFARYSRKMLDFRTVSEKRRKRPSIALGLWFIWADSSAFVGVACSGRCIWLLFARCLDFLEQFLEFGVLDDELVVLVDVRAEAIK